MDIPAPFRLDEVTVSPAWTDYNHHLTESAYLLIMGESSDAFFRFFGVDDAYREAGHSLYTVETHLRNLREAREGERLSLTIQVLGTDAKRLHIVHEMYLGPAGGLIATAEQMLLHVDTRAGQAVPFPGPVAGRLREISAAHAALPVPGYVGRSIAIPGRLWTSRSARNSGSSSRSCGPSWRRSCTRTRTRSSGWTRCRPSWPGRSGPRPSRPGSTRPTCRPSWAAAGSTRCPWCWPNASWAGPATPCRCWSSGPATSCRAATPTSGSGT